jgi:hypothetical protein
MRTLLVIAGLALAVTTCGPSPPRDSPSDRMSDEAAKALVEDLRKSNREFDEAIRKLRADLNELETSQRELMAKLEEQNRQIEAGRAELSKAEVAREASPPRASRPDDPPGTIRGVVQARNNDVDIVIVSVGSRDEVNEGMEFSVTRSGKPVATIVIDRVFANYSSGSFKPGTPKTPIEFGDECVSPPRTETPK